MDNNRTKVAELLRRMGAPAQHLKLLEEVKELTDAITTGQGDIADEIADVGIVLTGLAIAHGVDLEAVMARKLRVLMQSQWVPVGDGTFKRIKIEGGEIPVPAAPPKQDSKKPDLSLLFRAFGPVLDDIARLTSFGEQKYSPLGWREQENGKARYISAAMRHISAHLSGTEIDEESGLPHLVHAAWCIMAAQYLNDK
jgi:phosphoribosyl-ATP pyrophosphohydrolase